MPTSLTALNALAWTLTSVAILLTFGRFWIRWNKNKNLVWDDFLNGVALAALLGYIATYTVYFPIQYAADFYVLGLSNYIPPDYQMAYAVKLALANVMLFWITIFAVKASFLALYYYIFNISRTFRKVWWCATIYTIFTFLAIFLGTLWSCETPSQFGDVQACTESDLTLTVHVQAYWMGLNVSGDLLLIVLPLVMLRKMFTIQKSQKLALTGIFLIVVIDILFDVLRTVYSIDAALADFEDANLAWVLCEPTIAVIVCALPSYGSLLSSPLKRRGWSYETIQESATSRGQKSRRQIPSHDCMETEMESLPHDHSMYHTPMPSEVGAQP